MKIQRKLNAMSCHRKSCKPLACWGLIYNHPTIGQDRKWRGRHNNSHVYKNLSSTFINKSTRSRCSSFKRFKFLHQFLSFRHQLWRRLPFIHNLLYVKHTSARYFLYNRLVTRQTERQHIQQFLSLPPTKTESHILHSYFEPVCNE